jgi:hypothetical protein
MGPLPGRPVASADPVAGAERPPAARPHQAFKEHPPCTRTLAAGLARSGPARISRCTPLPKARCTTPGRPETPPRQETSQARGGLVLQPPPRGAGGGHANTRGHRPASTLGSESKEGRRARRPPQRRKNKRCGLFRGGARAGAPGRRNGAGLRAAGAAAAGAAASVGARGGARGPGKMCAALWEKRAGARPSRRAGPQRRAACNPRRGGGSGGGRARRGARRARACEGCGGEGGGRGMCPRGSGGRSPTHGPRVLQQLR